MLDATRARGRIAYDCDRLSLLERVCTLKCKLVRLVTWLLRQTYAKAAQFTALRHAGKMLYKGAFQVGHPSGKWQSPFDIQVRSCANTGVIDWNSQVLALHETDLPHALDGALHTVGRTEMNIWDDKDNVAAHYRVVAEADGSERLVTCAPPGKGKATECRFVEFDEAGIVVRSGAELLEPSVSGCRLVLDCISTGL